MRFRTVRPRTVQTIEVIAILVFLTDIVFVAVDPLWSESTLALIYSALMLGLAFLVTRRRSKLARLVITLLFVPSLVILLLFYGGSLSELSRFEMLSLFPTWTLTLIEIVLMWTSQSSRWLSSKHAHTDQSLPS